MSRYDSLEHYLRQQNYDQVPMTFRQVEQIVGKLPASARRHRPWWSNNPANNVMTKAWLEAGYETANVDLAAEKLVFHRRKKLRPVRPAPSAGALRHPAFRCMAGQGVVAENTDLTQPADPEWGRGTYQ